MMRKDRVPLDSWVESYHRLGILRRTTPCQSRLGKRFFSVTGGIGYPEALAANASVSAMLALGNSARMRRRSERRLAKDGIYLWPECARGEMQLFGESAAGGREELIECIVDAFVGREKAADAPIGASKECQEAVLAGAANA